jgi:anti-sigma regulatory factor (Ser/Thr protein kinase)
MPTDPQTVLHGFPPLPASDDVLKLPFHARSVAAGRRFVVEALTDAPDAHVWAVVQCTSELLTNALAAAERHAAEVGRLWQDSDAPVHLAVRRTARWTRIDVRDPETVLHPVGPHGSLDEDGRGLGIVMALGHFAHTVFADHKVVHALLPLGEPLTDAERAAALVTA